jgi:hypothetical protein
MLLMCLSILACWASLKTWQVYMMTVKPDDWVRLSEIEHRRRLAWADKFGDQGKDLVMRIVGRLTR